MNAANASAQQFDVLAGLAEVKAFNVVGVSVVTSNETAAEDINALWERLFRDSIGQKVQQKSGDVIYAVYSNYEGDHTKPFRVTLGYRTETDSVPDGLHRIQVAEQEYAVLSASGKQPQAIIETWRAVWASDLNRSFKTDFEIYGPRFFEEGLHEALIHIGIEQ